MKVDDNDIKDSNALVQAISKAEPGDVMSFEIYRQGQEIQIDVEIGSKNESALKDEEEAEEDNADQDMQEPPQDWQQELPGWSINPFEDFFDFYFGN